MLLLRVAQDVGHAGGGTTVPTAAQRLERLLSMAGFQVSIYGRFWVSAEAHLAPTIRRIVQHGTLTVGCAVRK